MRPRWLVYLLIAAPLCWFFGRMVWQQEVLDFRDICHYYRPLWQWTSSEWTAGRVPLWCDLDGLGLPLHADPTASTFYPGQLLFALPCSFTTRLNLYVVLHVLLAAALMYRTARAFAATRVGATAAAISYAYGGHVLFQYCNPIFLVGAAWLPLAALAIERACTLCSWRWGVVLGATVALVVLGGDVQLAYHVALLAAVYVWLAPQPVDRRWQRAGLLAGGLVLAGLLSAVQILATAEWSAHSERALADDPRSLWELHHAGSAAKGIFGMPARNSHHERIYDFSVGPWRWLEFLWPNIGGRMLPQHQRWMSALPAEGRIWSPSLYMGLFPFLAAIAAFSLRRAADHKTRWLSWMTLLGVLGTLGVYGLGWMWQELQHDLLFADPSEPSTFGAVGGLYWWMVVVLPGYVQFRYPAKLMVLASLGLSLLAARGWDQLFAAPPKWLRVLTAAMIVVSVVFAICSRFGEGWLHDAPAEYPFGPLVVSGAINDVAWAALQTLFLSSILLFLIARRHVWRWTPALAVCITAIELCIAHGWMISSTSQALFDQPIAIRDQSPQTTKRIYRAFPDKTEDEHELPPSDDRLTQVGWWERATLAEKIGLAQQRNVANMTTTLEPSDLIALWRHIDRTDAPEVSLRKLGIDGRLQPAAQLLKPDDSTLTPVAGSASAYLATDVQILAPLASPTREQLVARTQQLFSVDDSPVTFVETADDLDVAGLQHPTAADAILSCERHSPTHVTVDLRLQQPRLLVLADYFAPGWKCELVDQRTGQRHSATIHRTNRVLRGVVVPAGEYRAVFRYRPGRLYLGAAISAIAWLAVVVVIVRYRRSTRKEPSA